MPRPVVRAAAAGSATVLSVLVLTLSACGGGDAPPPVEEGITVSGVGFMTPESVLHDSIADVYLVSNINGEPAAEDDNGFISRLTPEGQVEELKWIDGASSDLTLNAPKGMAIRGDTLFVADIRCIRQFHRVSGEHVDSTCFNELSFINDIAVGGQDQSLFITDTGVDANFQPLGTDAVYRMPMREGAQGATIAKSPDLGAPNGVAVGRLGILVVTFRSGEVLAFDAQGNERVVVPAGKQLDGVVYTSDGGFLYSSWGDSAVFRVSREGQHNPMVTGIESPADIGYDARRNRVLIPLFYRDEVLIRDVR